MSESSTAQHSPATIRHKHRFTEERKQSASDLQSRLKTRKLLGVGELAGDNGEVYKSKISQLLGINESLYVRLPRGMIYWNAINCFYFVCVGALCLFAPSVGMLVDYGIDTISKDALLFVRLYGVVMLSYGILVKCILQQRETRSDIATLLLVTAGLHITQFVVSILSHGTITWWAALIRSTCIIGNIAYHTFVDGQGGLHRQIIRVIEEFIFTACSPAVEKKPFVEVVETSVETKLVNVDPANNDEKKNA